MLYAAQFSKEGHGRYIVAGGSGSNEAKVFDHRNDNQVIGKCCIIVFILYIVILFLLLLLLYCIGILI